MPFAVVDGVVTNVTGADWDNVNSLQRVPAENEEEMVERFKSGERFRRFEAVRLFMKFGLHVEIPDPYRRLTNKLKKKLRQTKVEAGSYGRLVFIEVPFDLRLADKTKLSRSIAEAVQQSRNTLGVVLANREANPHHRHHYSMHGSLSRVGFALKPELVSLFERFQLSDTRTDLITGLPYQYSWQEALDRSEADMKASE